MTRPLLPPGLGFKDELGGARDRPVGRMRAETAERGRSRGIPGELPAPAQTLLSGPAQCECPAALPESSQSHGPSSAEEETRTARRGNWPRLAQQSGLRPCIWPLRTPRTRAWLQRALPLLGGPQPCAPRPQESFPCAPAPEGRSFFPFSLPQWTVSIPSRHVKRRAAESSGEEEWVFLRRVWWFRSLAFYGTPSTPHARCSPSLWSGLPLIAGGRAQLTNEVLDRQRRTADAQAA